MLGGYRIIGNAINSNKIGQDSLFVPVIEKHYTLLCQLQSIMKNKQEILKTTMTFIMHSWT